MVTPDALTRLNYWETNINRYANANLEVWKESEDHRFVLAILDGARQGEFGPVDMGHVNAIGESSQ